ncbi:hypothetical protein [Tsukamurella soli]|uniref:hypothetical protein n=1 Tax=Tsukamurella soli TaxID=644556 RepID=UPI0031E715FF
MIQVVDAPAVVAALIERSPAGGWCLARIAEAPVVAPHLMPFEAASIIRQTTIRGALSAVPKPAPPRRTLMIWRSRSLRIP